MRGLIRCCLFLCFPVLLWAQDGVQVKRERVFTGSGLYGFMNGCLLYTSDAADD